MRRKNLVDRRWAYALAAALCSLACWPAPVAAGAEQTCSAGVRGDVDGGGADVVLGLPSYDLPGKPDAGAVVVFSNLASPGESDPRSAAARRLLTAAHVGLTPQAGARFGAALTRLGSAGPVVGVGQYARGHPAIVGCSGLPWHPRSLPS